MIVTYSNSRNLKKTACLFGLHRSKVLKMSFANLPWKDLGSIENIRAPENIETIAIVGIGGSSLGAKTLIEACLPHANGKRFIFLDNVDPDFVSKSLKQLNLDKTFFALISKSGETIEILSLAKILLAKIKSPHNFLTITDNPESSLGKLAQKHRISMFRSQQNVPGRFSVLDIVGLLPASLAGIKINQVLSGAQNAKWKAAYELACAQYLAYASGKNISVIFPYAQTLESFSDWYIQLLSESIGKSKKIGITPTKAIGVKDQHSQLQLFLDGPDDKFYIFIKPETSRLDIKIPSEKFTLKNLFDSEYDGVKQAFINRQRTFVEISLPEITPEVLGELLFFFELEIAFLGRLLNVNIENQPAVELNKKITLEILKKH